MIPLVMVGRDFREVKEADCGEVPETLFFFKKKILRKGPKTTYFSYKAGRWNVAHS